MLAKIAGRIAGQVARPPENRRPRQAYDDPKDRHVIAAATLTRADVIVTFNLKDFPIEILKPLRLEARHPDIT